MVFKSSPSYDKVQCGWAGYAQWVAWVLVVCCNICAWVHHAGMHLGKQVMYVCFTFHVCFLCYVCVCCFFSTLFTFIFESVILLLQIITDVLLAGFKVRISVTQVTEGLFVIQINVGIYTAQSEFLQRFYPAHFSENTMSSIGGTNWGGSSETVFLLQLSPWVTELALTLLCKLFNTKNKHQKSPSIYNYYILMSCYTVDWNIWVNLTITLIWANPVIKLFPCT